MIDFNEIRSITPLEIDIMVNELNGQPNNEKTVSTPIAPTQPAPASPIWELPEPFEDLFLNDTNDDTALDKSFMQSINDELCLEKVVADTIECNFQNIPALTQSIDSLDVLNEFPARNKDQLNLLHLAIAMNSYDTCEYLLNKGVSIWEVDSTNSNALHYAALFSNSWIVQLLVSKIPPAELVNLENRNSKGMTPRDVALYVEAHISGTTAMVRFEQPASPPVANTRNNLR